MTAERFVFYFFLTAQKILKLYTVRTNGTFVFASTHETRPSQRAKRYILLTHRKNLYIIKTIVFCVEIDHAERMRSALERKNAYLVTFGICRNNRNSYPRPAVTDKTLLIN